MSPQQSQFQLQPMTYEDIQEVMVIETNVQSQPWSSGIFKDCIRVGYSCWVCKENNDQLVGYLIQSIAAEEMHILNVCIHPHWQRRNLGTLLVQHAETIALKEKVRSSFLEVRQSNLPAIRLYQKEGYKKIGIRKDYYPITNGREDAIVMSKNHSR